MNTLYGSLFFWVLSALWNLWPGLHTNTLCMAFLWSLHKDHHHKDHNSWFERNDAFFIFYAVVSMTCFYFWSYEGFWAGLPIGLGIMTYGATYFIVHDIFIHQRFKMFRNANNWYAKGFVVLIKSIINT